MMGWVTIANIACFDMFWHVLTMALPLVCLKIPLYGHFCSGKWWWTRGHCQLAPPWNVAVWKLETPRTSLEDKFYIFLLWKFQLIWISCGVTSNLSPNSAVRIPIFHVIRGNIPLHQFLHGFQPGAPISGRYHRGFHLQFQGNLPYSTILSHTQPYSTTIKFLLIYGNIYGYKIGKMTEKIIGNSKITSIRPCNQAFGAADSPSFWRL